LQKLLVERSKSTDNWVNNFSKLKKCNITGVFDDYDAFPNYIEIFSKFNNHEYTPSEYIIPNCRWRNAVIKWQYKNI
jgi:hypothetical protein